MPSAVDICNLALARLGDDATVSSIDPPEGSAQAEHCKVFYPMARDTMLDAHAWSFITTRKALAELDETPPAGWLYTYAKPSGAIKLLAVLAADALDDSDPQPFISEILPDGTEVILSNTPNAVLRYTIRQTDPTHYPPLFVDALSMLLASHLAGPILKGSTGISASKAWLSAFATQFGAAKVADTNQRRVERTHTPNWMSAR